MTEKYGVEFEAITEKFKTKMRGLANDIRNFGKEAEENTKITPNINTGYEKQINYVKSQMQEIQYLLNRADAGKEIGKDTLKLEAEYETLSYKLEDLLEKQKEFNGELEETNKTSSRNGINLGAMFDKSISKIKRFTFYLLGARSVFSLFMKYQGIYYQYNEQMQYQSELSQNAIALSLAPAFEFLGNVIAYASIAFAKFIELLTGVNILTKVSTKGIRDYNKGLKESQTLLSGIDEITNLTMPSATGLASQYQALNDFQKKVAEVEEFFKRNKWITSLIDGLKEVWRFLTEKLIPIVADFISQIGGVKGALILLGGTAVLKALGKLIGTAGVGATAGTGLAGIAGLLAFITGIFTTTQILKGIQELEETQTDRRNLRTDVDAYKQVVGQIKEATEKLKTMSKGTKEYEDTLKYINERWKIVNNDIQFGQDNVLDTTDDVKELAKELDEVTDSSNYTDVVNISEAIGIDKLEDKTKSGFQKLAEGLLGIDKENKLRRQAYLEMIDEIQGKEEKAVDKVKYKLGDIETRIKSIIKKDYKLKMSIDVISKIGEGATAGAKAISDAVAKAIRGYANGLDYVPYDNYPALLHKGEAVVPAKYNPTIHGMGNDYTNSLLETLILKMDDLSRRPNVFEIDGQRFANATYGAYEDARSRQNYLEGVEIK